VLIAARATNGVIGAAGTLPWRSRTDLKRFKAVTDGHALILGRTTFEGLPGPLPGRTIIVVTASDWQPPAGVHIARTPVEALALAETLDPAGPTFIGGGARLYRACLASGLVAAQDITTVDATPQGDATLDAPDPAEWRVASDSGWYDPGDGGPALRHQHFLRASPDHGH
jgi:dihydrofolate reductase